MEAEVDKEYKCKNKYCYVYNVPQFIPQDGSTDCHNCGFKLIEQKISRRK